MTNPLEQFVDRVRHEPYFLAYWLDVFATGNGFDETRLIEALGCTSETLQSLRLCRVPRDTGEGFREDVEIIARRFGLDPVVLGKAIKSARATLRLREAAPTQPAGFLMAARDREAAPPAENDP